MKHIAVTTGLPIVVLAAVVAAAGEDAFLGRSTEEWNKQFQSSERQTRVYAAWAIAQLASKGKDSTVLSNLEPLLKDSDPTVRYWGVMGLQFCGQNVDKGNATEVAAVTDRLRPLLEDKSAAPRIAAAESLALLRQADKALPVLLAAMDDPQESVRIQAVAALEKIGPAARPAIDTLQKAMTDSSEYVKRISERSLASLGVVGKSPPGAKAKKGKAKAKSQP